MPETPYQPIDSAPELGAVQPCQERMDLIASVLNDLPATYVDATTLEIPRPLTVLDLGCHTGWFCRRFALNHWRAIGVDRSPDWIAEAQRQNQCLRGPKPEYHYADLFTFKLPAADVALCLSVAMYLFDDVAKGWALMDRISKAAPIMFLDFGGMYADRLPFTEADVIERMCSKTQYTKGELLGRTAMDRPFYVFTR